MEKNCLQGEARVKDCGLKIYRVYVMLEEIWRNLVCTINSNRVVFTEQANREGVRMMTIGSKKLEAMVLLFKNCFRVLVIWGSSTMLAIVLDRTGVRIENLLLLYVVGIVICSVQTSSLCWGIISAVVLVLNFNFMFTTPKFSLQMDDPNYVISQVIFIIVALIVASLTVKLRKQMDIATIRTNVTIQLNNIGNGFLNLSGQPAIVLYSRESLNHLTGRQVDILLRDKKETAFSDGMAEWCYKNSMACGSGEARFGEDSRLYMPITNSSKTYGVIIFDCLDGILTEEERLHVNTVIAQITLVLERERLNEEKELTMLQIEKERLKSTLLRSISHDLRTPLTGIAGNVNFLYDNYETVDLESARSMLKDMCMDAEWLNSMVENLLNMTRIQDGRLEIGKKKEVVDDLISGAVTLISKRLGSHKLKTSTPSEIMLIPVDARLFTQVLVNLIDNAVKHSGENTEITVAAEQKGSSMIFTVSDNGVGIPTEKMEYIFDNFFTTAYQNGDRRRGAGLGLTICRAIVEAHGGHIEALENRQKGATFLIDLPMEELYDK